MQHYKSWSGLQKQLNGFLCEELRGRISYFLTRYHDVHNAYGRAAILLDGAELVCFSWPALYRQDADMAELWNRTGQWDCRSPTLRQKWDAEQTWHDLDFLNAALIFVNLPVTEALESENSIIRIFAILDRRVGKRTLRKISSEAAYRSLPEWVRQFYSLRLGVSAERSRALPCSHGKRLQKH